MKKRNQIPPKLVNKLHVLLYILGLPELDVHIVMPAIAQRLKSNVIVRINKHNPEDNE